MRLSALGNSDGGMTGKHHSEKSNEQNRQAHLGKVPWNKGKTMPQSFCRTTSEVQEGKTIPQSVRDKISLSLKEYEFTEKHRKNISESLVNREFSEETILKLIESHYKGGFWLGNVRYPPVYCELWKNVNPRVHAFFNYKCCLCGIPENGRSHIGHHVFYVKEACCWFDESGQYYTNLNAKDHPAKDYYIGENPNYFVILCDHCHGKTQGNFANRKEWADYFKKMIDQQYGGKCYFTKDEFNKIKAGQIKPA